MPFTQSLLSSTQRKSRPEEKSWPEEIFSLSHLLTQMPQVFASPDMTSVELCDQRIVSNNTHLQSLVFVIFKNIYFLGRNYLGVISPLERCPWPTSENATFCAVEDASKERGYKTAVAVSFM